MRKRTILIVMPDAFHHGWLGSSKRIFHLVEAFRDLNFEVALQLGRMVNEVSQGELVAQFPGKVFISKKSGAYPTLFDRSKFTRRVWRGVWKAMGPDKYLEKFSYGWAKTLDVQAVVEALDDAGVSPYLVWGISGGKLEGAMAASRIAHVLGVPWVMEMHDPPYGAGLGRDVGSVGKAFAWLVDDSKAIIVNSLAYQAELINRFGKRMELVQNLYLTFEGRVEIVPKVNPCLTIVYGGSLAGMRGLSTLLLAMAAALKTNPQMAGLIEARLYGGGDGFAQAVEEAKALGLGDAVRQMGYLGRQEMEDQLLHSDLLLVLQSHEASRFEIPGKIFECMRCGNPIIGIMPNCETADMLRASGLGAVFEESDDSGLADFLVRIWIDWKKRGSISADINESYINQFSRDHLPERLRDVLVSSGCI